MRALTTAMYHYCRPVARSRWPRIRGLELDDFRSQLAYLKWNYTIVSLPEVINALDGGELPPNACLLTFDDGYADHYQHVFPLLHDAKASGAFFPIGRSVAERWLAPVNKIHFVLHEAKLAQVLEDIYDETGERPLASSTSRFDHPDVAFVKRVLQDPSLGLVDSMFSKYVRAEEHDLADELYMTPEQIKVMAANGMHFGVHGWSHVRFSRMTEAEQAADLGASIALLRGLGVLPERWAMAYPYGAADDYNDTTANLLRASGCAAAFTTHSAVCDLRPRSPSGTTVDNRLTLPRLDTNDVPRA